MSKSRFGIAAALALLVVACAPSRESSDSRIVIRYWEKWTGFEAQAMRVVVEEFNASQDRIYVEYSSVSQIDRRLMLAIAGGVPPDVAGIWGHVLPVYAENNALTPLDSFAEAKGVGREDYIPVFWDICSYRGHLWALPSTPGSLALIWNKDLFREAGLDPNTPPRSLEEMEAFNENLSRLDSDGRLVAAGHLPAEPGWWPAVWGWTFGGDWMDADGTLQVHTPETLTAFKWIASYPERYGAANLMSFRDGFGNFASPQNPFFTGRVAMVMQGPWIYNFIQNYAPDDFEWGVAPFPSSDPERLGPVSLVETDVLVIPAGAAHPEAAFEFIRYLNQQGPMEKLCLGQRKFSPLHATTDTFYAAHPNPHIRTFEEVARSPQARFLPQTTVWNLFSNELNQAFARVWAGQATPDEALREAHERVEEAAAHRERRWKRMEATLRKEWGTP